MLTVSVFLGGKQPIKDHNVIISHHLYDIFHKIQLFVVYCGLYGTIFELSRWFRVGYIRVPPDFLILLQPCVYSRLLHAHPLCSKYEIINMCIVREQLSAFITNAAGRPTLLWFGRWSSLVARLSLQNETASSHFLIQVLLDHPSLLATGALALSRNLYK